MWTTDRSTNGNVVSTSSLSRHTTSGNESTESSSSLSRHVSCGNLSFPNSEDVSVHVVSSGYQSGLVPSGSESVVSSHSLSRHVSQDEGTYGVVFVGREIGGCGTDFEDSSINIESGDGPSVDEILSMLGVVSQDERYFGSDFSIPLQSDSQHGNGNRNKVCLHNLVHLRLCTYLFHLCLLASAGGQHRQPSWRTAGWTRWWTREGAVGISSFCGWSDSI